MTITKPELEGVDLLREVRDHILAHPEEHNQRYWTAERECGTTHCAAGWAVALAYPTATFVARDVLEPGLSTGWLAVIDGIEVPIEETARDLIGLTANEVEGLFFTFCSAERTAQIIDKIIESRSS